MTWPKGSPPLTSNNLDSSAVAFVHIEKLPKDAVDSFKPELLGDLGNCVQTGTRVAIHRRTHVPLGLFQLALEVLQLRVGFSLVLPESFPVVHGLVPLLLELPDRLVDIGQGSSTTFQSRTSRSEFLADLFHRLFGSVDVGSQLDLLFLLCVNRLFEVLDLLFEMLVTFGLSLELSRATLLGEETLELQVHFCKTRKSDDDG